MEFTARHIDTNSLITNMQASAKRNLGCHLLRQHIIGIGSNNTVPSLIESSRVMPNTASVVPLGTIAGAFDLIVEQIGSRNLLSGRSPCRERSQSQRAQRRYK